MLGFYDLPEGDISGEHPNMYWPFGQHILEPAKLLASHPNLYAILLTHHGCGPDSVLSHYFRELMGAKPYLNIEVDEHSSDVGVVTRLEAFINSLGGQEIPGKERRKKETLPGSGTAFLIRQTKGAEIDGAITAASTYENTGISMNILHKGFENGRPVINLTFDGNKNENDRTRIESFLYYL